MQRRIIRVLACFGVLALFLCIAILPTSYYYVSFAEKHLEIVNEVANSASEVKADYPEVRSFDWLATLEDALAEGEVNSGNFNFGANKSLYGRLVAPSVKLSIALYFPGDEKSTLAKGAMIASSTMPGEPGISAIAFHNWPQGHKLGDLGVGSQFSVIGATGTLTYNVILAKVGNMHDIEVFPSASAGSINRVVLYTCFPFDSLSTDQRFYVVGDRVW